MRAKQRTRTRAVVILPPTKKARPKARRAASPRPRKRRTYQHKARVKKTRLRASYAVAVARRPASKRQQPRKARPRMAKPLRVVRPAQPSTRTRRPLPVPAPRRSPWKLRRVWIIRLREPPPDLLYKQAKAQFRQIKRAARVLRKFDRIAHHAVNELMQHAAHDMAERRRQASEGAREQKRHLHEEEAAAVRADRQRRASIETPQI